MYVCVFVCASHVSRRASLGWMKGATVVGKAEARRQEAKEIGRAVVKQLTSLQRGCSVALKTGNEGTFKEPRAVWLSEDRRCVRTYPFGVVVQAVRLSLCAVYLAVYCLLYTSPSPRDRG